MSTKNSLFSAIELLLLMILVVGFLGVGMLKLVAFEEMVASFERWGFPLWSMYVVGAIELSLSLLILVPNYRNQAALGIIILMLGAIGVHTVNQEWSALYGPIIVILMCVLLLFSRKK